MATRYISSWTNQMSSPYSPFVNSPSAHTLASYGDQAAGVSPPSTAGCNGCASCSPMPVMPSQYQFVEMSKPMGAVCTKCGPMPVAPAAPAGASEKCDVCINSREAKISKNLKVNLRTITIVLIMASAVGMGIGIADIVVSKLNFFKNTNVFTPCSSGLNFGEAIRPTSAVGSSIFWVILAMSLGSSFNVFITAFFCKDACKYSDSQLNSLLTSCSISLGIFIPIQISFSIINLLMSLSCVNGSGSPAEGLKIAAPVLLLVTGIIELILLAIVASIVSKIRKCRKKARKNASTVYDPKTGSYTCNCSSCLAAMGGLKPSPHMTPYTPYAPSYSSPTGCTSCNAY